MSAVAIHIIDLPLRDDLEAAVEDAVRACGGDPRSAVRALILGQRQLTEQLVGAVSTGYVRGSLR